MAQLIVTESKQAVCILYVHNMQMMVQGGVPAWQYAQANGVNGHLHNGFPQGMLPSDMFVAQQAGHAGQKHHQAAAATNGSGLGHEPAMWNARYDM